MTFRNKISPNSILLFSIISVATVLRFWNFSEIAYMHDELSGLGRTQYNSLHDLIIYGVKINDTHPAGVQVFLYYWTKLFGYSEQIVKLPFILCGIFSLLLAYGIAKQWFTNSVALIVVSFMAVMQYTIMYSQLARPYSSGVFLCLLMVYCWSSYIFKEQHQKKWLVGFVLSATACAYNHHFALLFAIIVSFTGIVFIAKEMRKAYIIAGICIFLLYTPHLSIFLFQLNKGGLGGSDGWLQAPNSGWLYTYIKYLFHFSYAMYVLVFILLLFSIFYVSPELKNKNKFRIICISWFFINFFIQYFYSVKISAIIQYSTLIFAFPFFLMFLFSLFKELSFKWNALFVIGILAIGIGSLIFERQHFRVFYKQPYQQAVKDTYEWSKEFAEKSNVTVNLIFPSYFKKFSQEHYTKKYKQQLSDSIYFKTVSELSTPKNFRAALANLKTHYFIAGNLPPEYVQIIQEYYPFMREKDEGFTYSNYCFSKTPFPSSLGDKVLYSKVMPLNTAMNDSIEWGKPLSLKLKDICYSRHTMLIISTSMFVKDTSSKPLLVTAVDEDGVAIDWRGMKYEDFNTSKDTLNTVYLCFDLTSFNFKKHPDAHLQIYIWNKDKKPYAANSIRFKAIEWNPSIYGLSERLD